MTVNGNIYPSVYIFKMGLVMLSIRSACNYSPSFKTELIFCNKMFYVKDNRWDKQSFKKICHSCSHIAQILSLHTVLAFKIHDSQNNFLNFSRRKLFGHPGPILILKCKYTLFLHV